MVKVYLPMGYPLLSGNEFENVIYQGNVARLYTIATDPRSDAQLQNRNFLKDLVKVRSTLGPWGVAACKSALGPKWWTVLYQVIKADIEGWWSAALAEWEGFQETNQDAWRLASPYQATFNDVGMIYFCLSRVIYHALVFYSGLAWESAEWAEGASSSALTWWTKTLATVMVKGDNDETDGYFEYTGTWAFQEYAPAFNGGYRQVNAASGGSVKFYFLGRRCEFHMIVGPTFGSLKWQLDNEAQEIVSMYYADGLLPWVYPSHYVTKGLHLVRINSNVGLGNFDYFQVR